jgi:hypothetical protein
MDAEVIAKFEKLFDNHKDALIDAAHATHKDNDVIWINLCNIYEFEKKDREDLRAYIRQHYSPKLP